MRIIDRYIIRKYLSTFFFTALLFSMISVAIDFSQQVDQFVNAKMTTRQILEFYMNFIPYINGLLWPLFSLIAVIFFTSRLAQDSEIISIMNSGLSYWRLNAPYLLSAGLITIMLLYANHRLIPRANTVRYYYEDTIMRPGKEKFNDHNVHIRESENQIVFIRSYNRQDSLARDVRLERFENGKLKSVLKAKTMSIIKSPNLWQIKGYEYRLFNGKEEALRIEQGGIIDTVLNIYHSDFISHKHDMERMITPELKKHINKQKLKGSGNTRSFEVEVHRRTAEPITVIILTIIGLAVSSRKIRGGMGLNLALGVLLGALFIFISRLSVTMSTNESLSPFLGVWIPNFAFILVAVRMAYRASR